MTSRRALLRTTLLAPLAALVTPLLPSKAQNRDSWTELSAGYQQFRMEKLREELAAWKDFPEDEDLFYDNKGRLWVFDQSRNAWKVSLTQEEFEVWRAAKRDTPQAEFFCKASRS